MATGGYAYEFAEAVPEKYKCAHCRKVLKSPHLIQCCSKHSCESCLQQLLRERGKQRCPFCGHSKREGFEHIKHYVHGEEARQLRIHCTKRSEGCEAILPLRDLGTHLDEACGYVTVRCSNRCGETPFRQDHQNHLQNWCRLRQYRCQYNGCRYEDTFEIVTEKHQDTCKHRLFDCPNRCCQTPIKIKQKDISAHREGCPKQPVDCPFREVGCNEPLVREEIPDHLEKSQVTHSLQQVSAMTAMASGIQAEVGILKSTCTPQSKSASLSCIETHLRLGRRTLQKKGDVITERMASIPEYVKNGQVWYSIPFYYMEGYKMQLLVRTAAGTHISVSLLVLRGEYDDRLRWPIAADIISREQLDRATGSRDPATGSRDRDTGSRDPATGSHDRSRTPLQTILGSIVTSDTQESHQSDTTFRKKVIATLLDQLQLSQAVIKNLDRNMDVRPIIVDLVSPTDFKQDVSFAYWPFGVIRVTGGSDSRPMSKWNSFEANPYDYTVNDSLVFRVSLV